MNDEVPVLATCLSINAVRWAWPAGYMGSIASVMRLFTHCTAIHKVEGLNAIQWRTLTCYKGLTLPHKTTHSAQMLLP